MTTAFIVAPAHDGAGSRAWPRWSPPRRRRRCRVCIAGAVTDRHGEARAAELIDEGAALVERAKKGWGDRLRALHGVAPLSEVGEATLAAVAERARATGAGVYVHAGADESDARDALQRHGTTPAGRLLRAGLFTPADGGRPGARAGPRPTRRCCAASGAIWATTPRSDIEGSGGSFDYVALGARGLVPALGAGDRLPHPLGEVEAAYRAARRHGQEPAPAARVAAQMLFERGAELAQRHFVPGLGNLLPGSPADLVVLDAFPATPLGPENWIDHLVHGLTTARPQAVMVAGELLVADGRTTAIDEREVQRQARAAAHRLWPKVAR